MSESIVTPGNIIALGIVGGGLYFAYRTYQDFNLKSDLGKLGGGIAQGGVEAGKTIFNEGIKPIGKAAFTGEAAKKFWNPLGKGLKKTFYEPAKSVHKALDKTNPAKNFETVFKKDTWKKAFKKIF